MKKAGSYKGFRAAVTAVAMAVMAAVALWMAVPARADDHARGRDALSPAWHAATPAASPGGPLPAPREAPHGPSHQSTRAAPAARAPVHNATPQSWGRPGWSSHGWTVDTRYHHDHYYPIHGTRVRTLPPGCRHVVVGGVPYFFYAGVWFRPYLGEYVVVGAPWGAEVPVLPPGYTVVWIGSSVYYYANGVYYASLPDGQYQVVGPPVGPAVTQAPPTSTLPPAPPPSNAASDVRSVPSGDGLYVYPREQQSALQEATDRHDCDRWAQQQTGYDFERPEQSDPDLFDDFQRAVIACLDARGYSAR
jgi:hypothetical protein